MANGQIPSHVVSDNDDFYYNKNGTKYVRTSTGKWMPENSLKNLADAFPTGHSVDPEEMKKYKEITEKRVATMRRRKQIKEDLNWILSLSSEGRKEFIDENSIGSFEELKTKDINQQTLIIQALIMRAQEGDVKAIELIYKLLGEMAPEKTEVNIVNEAQGALNNVLSQLEQRGKQINDEEGSDE